MSIRLILSAAAVLLLAGCAAAPVAQPTPEPTRAPVSSGPVPDVPVVSGKLAAPRAAVPPVSVEVPSAGLRVAVTPVGVQPDGLMEAARRRQDRRLVPLRRRPAERDGNHRHRGPRRLQRIRSRPVRRPQGSLGRNRVVVTLTNGAQARYAIESVTSVLKDQLPLADVFDRAGDPRLVLITCGGQFDYSAGSYSDNIVVVAVPVAS